MMYMNVKALVEITRPANCLMAAFGVFIGYSIAAGAIVCTAALGAAMAIAFLVCAGGMAANDVFDAGVDKKLSPGKPIPSGRLSEKAALHFASGLFVAGNLLAYYYLPVVSVGISLAFTLLLIVYARYLPKAKYLGNWVVAAGTAFTLIFGASLVGNYAIVGLFALAALFANVAREIVKDIEDLEQDKGFKVSLPMRLGMEKARAVAVICTVLAVVLSYVPHFMGFGGMGFLALLTAANLGFVFALRNAYAGNFSGSQKAYKAAMLLALIAFLAGVVA